jgi:hypothetical protein
VSSGSAPSRSIAESENTLKALGQDRDLREVTAQIIKNAIGVFDKFNRVRNNQSLAHDNELLDPAEARFIYDSITAILRFVKSVEANKFDAAAPNPMISPSIDDEVPF